MGKAMPRVKRQHPMEKEQEEMQHPMGKAMPRVKRQHPMEKEQEEMQTDPELRRLARLATLKVQLFVMILRLICVIDSSVVLCLMLGVRMGLIGNTIVSRA